MRDKLKKLLTEYVDGPFVRTCVKDALTNVLTDVYEDVFTERVLSNVRRMY